jgi:protocatechuate 3,4-dioxygenase beta subunit
MNSLEHLFRPLTSLRARDKFWVFTQEVTHNLHSNPQFEDDVNWKENSTGVLTAKSAYFTLKNGPKIKTNIDEI